MSLAAVSTVASVLVGATFLVSGAAKIAAGRQWPIDAQALGAPPLVTPAVPFVEIVIGALLCAQVARPVPAIIAIAMLLGFSALLVVRLAEGRHPPCACFGSWSAKPLGWRHVLRNAVLIALAVLAAGGHR
ncbi:MAG: MauE/DoxX family redox-associated membrane protein [Ilumatobacteraceae bacterium]